MIYVTTSEKTKHRYFSLKKVDNTDTLRASETFSSGFKQAINNWSFVLIYSMITCVKSRGARCFCNMMFMLTIYFSKIPINKQNNL